MCVHEISGEYFMKNHKAKNVAAKIMKNFFSLIIFITFSLPVYGDQSSDKKFEEGKPVIWIDRSSNNRRVEGKILINATVDECWKVASDFDGWADWCPGMVYSRTVGKVGDHIIGMSGEKVFFLTVHLPEKVLLDEEKKILSGQQLSNEEVAEYKKMGWDLIEANYTKDFREEHRLAAYGDKTIWYYAITFEMKYSVPKMWEDLYCKMAVPIILKAAKKGVESEITTIKWFFRDFNG